MNWFAGFWRTTWARIWTTFRRWSSLTVTTFLARRSPTTSTPFGPASSWTFNFKTSSSILSPNVWGLVWLESTFSSLGSSSRVSVTRLETSISSRRKFFWAISDLPIFRWTNVPACLTKFYSPWQTGKPSFDVLKSMLHSTYNINKKIGSI